MKHVCLLTDNSHCDGKDIAGCSDGHARAEHHLLTVAVQNTVIRVPGGRKGERDVHLLVSFPSYETRCCTHKDHEQIKQGMD